VPDEPSITGSVLVDLIEDLRQRGYERDVKMIEAGLYQQMQYARRVRMQEHDDRYQIVVDDAAAYPDALALATEGLIDSLTSSQGMANRRRFERASRERIVFWMTHSV
jgi:hypothetical protein